MVDENRDFNKTPKIKVIGVGGAGNNAVNTMIEDNVRGVSFYNLNTEIGSLKKSRTNNIIQIGANVTNGLGAGANENIGEKAAIESRDEIKNILQGTDLLFITAGMGGGTGTGAAPVIANIAKEMGILTIGVVSKPFLFEGKQRRARAEYGTQNLKQYVDDLIVILNDNLLKLKDKKITFKNAFSMADNILEQGITSITDLLRTTGDVNIDFADIKTIMNYRGRAYMGIGIASGEQKIEEAVKQAIDSSLTETKINGAKGIIVNIKGNENLSLMEVSNAITILNDKICDDANIIFGTVTDNNLEDAVMVTVIATGIDEDAVK